MSYAQYALLAVYLGILAVICLYGAHRYLLVYLYYRHRARTPQLTACLRELPRVTVQLPMYNEPLVARRVIERACAIDYPRDRLQIQVLDDSTDQTTEIARVTVAEFAAQGMDIQLLHREQRDGYKAGALAAGMRHATGELICIFDADFTPPPRVLYETVHYFSDPAVGMVQARWSHLNREESWLTKAQAVLLDGHFVIEHGGRNRSGRFINFNGTAGIWRAGCIQDAGGWHHDTLTEDMDLSYRAQLRGWRFVFLPQIEVPAELPPTMSAFKSQQHRWTKGGVQTGRKLLRTILASPWHWTIKLEAFFHLTSGVVYACIVLLALLLYPVLYLKETLFAAHEMAHMVFDTSLMILATFSASSFYVCSQRELHYGWFDSVKYLPLLMSLGVGLALNNFRAAVQGLGGQPSEFVRTPKFGGLTGRQAVTLLPGLRAKSDFKWQPWIELAIGLYLLWTCVLCAVSDPISLGLPFLILFAFGYLYVAVCTFMDSVRACPTPVAARTSEQPVGGTA